MKIESRLSLTDLINAVGELDSIAASLVTRVISPLLVASLEEPAGVMSVSSTPERIRFVFGNLHIAPSALLISILSELWALEPGFRIL
jgi:hypothetical protein